LQLRINELEASLARVEEDLASKEEMVVLLRDEASRYRSYWMSESRINEMLYRRLPDGEGIDGVSQARDWDSSSPYYRKFMCSCLLPVFMEPLGDR
jgi:hypothetical protein